MSTELEAAWASWNRAPGEPRTAARLEDACKADAACGLTATDVRISLADAARAKLGTSVEIVNLPPAKPPRPESTRGSPEAWQSGPRVRLRAGLVVLVMAGVGD